MKGEVRCIIITYPDSAGFDVTFPLVNVPPRLVGLAPADHLDQTWVAVDELMLPARLGAIVEDYVAELPNVTVRRITLARSDEMAEGGDALWKRATP